ncbi:cortex morphogenetic protein CmpA [Bacillus infantis]
MMQIQRAFQEKSIYQIKLLNDFWLNYKK